MKRQVLEISHSTVTDNGLRFISQGPKGEHRWFSAFWRNYFMADMESLEEDTFIEKKVCGVIECLYLDRFRCPKLTTLGLQGARVSRYVIVIKNISLVILMKVSKCKIMRKISAWFTLMIRRGVAALLHYHPALKGEISWKINISFDLMGRRSKK